MTWLTKLPTRDGAYRVRLANGTEQEAWFILRKELWVTLDGASSLNVAGWQKPRLKAPEWEQ
jgi:hypothetical protein